MQVFTVWACDGLHGGVGDVMSMMEQVAVMVVVVLPDGLWSRNTKRFSCLGEVHQEGEGGNGDALSCTNAYVVLVTMDDVCMTPVHNSRHPVLISNRAPALAR